jgi:hypothetical protein
MLATGSSVTWIVKRLEERFGTHDDSLSVR